MALGIALVSTVGLRLSFHAAFLDSTRINLGIALVSTVGLRLEALAGRILSLGVQLGIALVSTVGLRLDGTPRHPRVGEDEVLGIALVSTVGLRLGHYLVVLRVGTLSLGIALVSTEGLRLAVPTHPNPAIANRSKSPWSVRWDCDPPSSPGRKLPARPRNCSGQ